MTDQKETGTQKPVTTRKNLEALIIARAWKDSNYKERLLRDPKDVVQEEVHAIDPSIKLPDTLQVLVHEESPTVYHLVLPRNPSEVSPAEVVGDDLEVVLEKPTIVRALRMG